MEFPGKRILWVDHQANEYSGLKKVLTSLVGCKNWKQVNTVADALDTLQKLHYDLLITELTLPMDLREYRADLVQCTTGLELIGELRGNTNWMTDKNCIICVFSNSGNPSRWAKARELVGEENGFLIKKPIFDKELEKTIRRICEHQF